MARADTPFAALYTPSRRGIERPPAIAILAPEAVVRPARGPHP
ncbi:MAG TPA: hypothetical protein VF177_10310 [Anaerolineae bacterium]